MRGLGGLDLYQDSKVRLRVRVNYHEESRARSRVRNVSHQEASLGLIHESRICASDGFTVVIGGSLILGLTSDHRISLLKARHVLIVRGSWHDWLA